MSLPLRTSPLSSPAILRLQRLARLDEQEEALLVRACDSGRRSFPPRSELLAENDHVELPLLILEGWACRARVLADGRQQIIDFLVPGDVIGVGGRPPYAALASVVAITETIVAPIDPGMAEGIARACEASRLRGEALLLRQVVRLGRMSAYERVAHLLLELHERLQAAGIATGGRFPLPVTQEVLADALGLTSVHVNRTLQTLRREGLISLRSGSAMLHDPAELASRADYQPLQV